MPSADDIANQQRLLATYRGTLAHYLNQQAIHGLAYAPPAVVHGIAEARAQIGQLKATLRGWGVEVEDLPGDEPAELLTPILGTQLDAFAALHQLRAVVGDFVGRDDEIARAAAALNQATARGTGAICAIRGLGGSGKTELAYAIAQRLIALYPDAQIVIELRGSGRRSLSAHYALQSAIRAFEPHARLPEDLSQLQALYRSLLSGKRALVLADDAHSAAQMRPLLPPPGSGLLITSRQRFSLPGMVAINLGMLPQAAAEQMLLAICPRIGAGATRVARLCGALPLALRIAAGVLASDTTLPVDNHIQALSSERERLARLREPDDPEVGVEASLALSYDGLDPDAQDVLNQLSVFTASFDRTAVAATVLPRERASAEGQAPPSLDDTLGLLYRRCLLEHDPSMDRFALHDLVRVFAAARLSDPAAIYLRYARHYAGVARAADQEYMQGDDHMLAGLALFDRERVHIDAAWAWARHHATSRVTDELILAYSLATTYTGNLRYDRRHERIPALAAAVSAARRLGAHGQEGRLLGNLGLAHAALGEAEQAIGLYEQALAIAQESADQSGEGNVLGNLGSVFSDLGDIVQAIAYYQRALAIKQAAGDQRGAANTLSNLGLAYADLGRTDQAVEHCERALTVVQALGDRYGEGTALGILADVYAILGDVNRAIECYEQALSIKREVGDRRGEARSHWNLGRLLDRLGNLEHALAHMQACVDYESETNHPDTEKDRVMLDALRQRLQSKTTVDSEVEPKP